MFDHPLKHTQTVFRTKFLKLASEHVKLNNCIFHPVVFCLWHIVQSDNEFDKFSLQCDQFAEPTWGKAQCSCFQPVTHVQPWLRFSVSSLFCSHQSELQWFLWHQQQGT